MNEYHMFSKHKLDLEEAARRNRNARFVEEVTRDKKAQPIGLRLDLHRWLPRFGGFRLRQPDPPCGDTPLSAH